jgi:hypothetical protein
LIRRFQKRKRHNLSLIRHAFRLAVVLTRIDVTRTHQGFLSIAKLIQAPPAPDESRFYGAILEALGVPNKPRGSVEEKQMKVLHGLHAVQLRVLIIDEIHHILAGHIAKQRHFLNVLKYLGNELKIPLVGVGTIDALRAIQTDPEMVNRFEPVALPRWEMNRDFQMLLASFERILPLRQPSLLAEPVMAAKLLALSEGTIGELFALLVAATVRAIDSGAERIVEGVLARIDWIAPSARRRAFFAAPDTEKLFRSAPNL